MIISSLIRAGLLILFFPWLLSAQQNSPILYTRSFTRMIERHPIQMTPLEGWFNVLDKTQDAYYQYDLVLVNEELEMEVRYKYFPAYSDSHKAYPDLALGSILSTIASNDDKSLIFIKGIPLDKLTGNLHAQWGTIATFKPKEEVSLLERGKVISYAHDLKGRIVVMFLYNGSSAKADPFLYNLSFQSDKLSDLE